MVANCLCLMKGLDHHQLVTRFPLTELFMSFGFIRLRRRRTFSLDFLFTIFYILGYCLWASHISQNWLYLCRFGDILASRAIRAAHCLTSIQVFFSYLCFFAFLYFDSNLLSCFITCHLFGTHSVTVLFLLQKAFRTWVWWKTDLTFLQFSSLNWILFVSLLMQFSPTSEHILLAYGRRHSSLLRSIVVEGENGIPVYTILEVDMTIIFQFPNHSLIGNWYHINYCMGDGDSAGSAVAWYLLSDTWDSKWLAYYPPQLLILLILCVQCKPNYQSFFFIYYFRYIEFQIWSLWECFLALKMKSMLHAFILHQEVALFMGLRWVENYSINKKVMADC
jgi:hypothetical protein